MEHPFLTLIDADPLLRRDCSKHRLHRRYIQYRPRRRKCKWRLKDADLVVTGEGRLDRQTAMGKAPIGVAKLAKKYGKMWIRDR